MFHETLLISDILFQGFVNLATMRSSSAYLIPCCTLLLLATQWLQLSTATSPHDQQQPLDHHHQPSEHDKPTNLSSPLFVLHRDLIKIESISGNEHAVGKYLSDYLTGHNFTVDRQEVEPLKSKPKHNSPQLISPPSPRWNILAYHGSSRKSRVLVSSHIDTVPPFHPYDVRPGNDIWGRGSVDAKGCVATQIIAVSELLASNEIIDGDVALLFVVGEEIGGDGMRKANSLGLSWETVIFGEPTELKLASGHKGAFAFSVGAKGKAGHSGYPWLGESANSMLIPALAVLDKLELPGSEKYGNTTVNIGRMEGGVAGNVIAEEASAQIQMRLASGTAEEAKKAVVEAVGEVDERLELEFLSRGYGPVDIDSDVEGRENCLSPFLVSLLRTFSRL